MKRLLAATVATVALTPVSAPAFDCGYRALERIKLGAGVDVDGDLVVHADRPGRVVYGAGSRQRNCAETVSRRVVLEEATRAYTVRAPRVRHGFDSEIVRRTKPPAFPLIESYCDVGEAACGGARIDVPEGASATVPAGAHGALRGRARGSVRIEGDATFCSIRLDRGSSLVAAEGAAVG